MTKLAEGRYLRCFECDHYTSINANENSSSTPCSNCDENGRDDPYCTVVVNISACPDPSGECGEENHHWGLGQHEVEE